MSYFKTSDLNNLIEFFANEFSDGHFTLCKFTTNYRAGFFTPFVRGDFDRMTEGKTLEEVKNKVLINFIRKLKKENNKKFINIINMLEIGLNLEEMGGGKYGETI